MAGSQAGTAAAPALAPTVPPLMLPIGVTHLLSPLRGPGLGPGGAAHPLCGTHGVGGSACTVVGPCMYLAGVCTIGSLTGTAQGDRGQCGDTGYWR